MEFHGVSQFGPSATLNESDRIQVVEWNKYNMKIILTYVCYILYLVELPVPIMRCPSPMAIDPESSTMKKRRGNMAQLLATAAMRPEGNPLDTKNLRIASRSIALLTGSGGGGMPANPTAGGIGGALE